MSICSGLWCSAQKVDNTTKLEENVRNKILAEFSRRGYDVNILIRVEQK